MAYRRARLVSSRRLGDDQAADHGRPFGEREGAFYDEHVGADAVHEQIVRHGVIAPLLDGEPHLADDVLFGIRGSRFLRNRLADLLLDGWEHGRSTLRVPLPDAPVLMESAR